MRFRRACDLGERAFCEQVNPCGVCDGDISLCFNWGCDGVTGSGLALDAC
eukprot:COSAG05_NODE_5421_length_1178_cov_14.859828_1_plen_49_part_10